MSRDVPRQANGSGSLAGAVAAGSGAPRERPALAVATSSVATGRAGFFHSQRRKAVTREEGAATIARLSALTAAGMSTAEALTSSARRGNRCAARLDGAVRRGLALSAAMASAGLPFGEAEVAVVRAGEKGGSTARALALLAARMEREREGRRRIASALAYPCILVGGAFAALAFLSIAVLPSFTALYAENEGQLPGVTMTMLRFGDALTAHGFTVALTTLAVLVVLTTLRQRSRRARRFSDRVAFDAPPLAALVAPAALHDTCSLLALLLEAGCEAEEALALAARAAANVIVAERLARTLRSLRHGVALSRAWASSGLDRSGDAVALLEIAEATGSYGQAFTRLAVLEGAAAEQALSRACRLAEPVAVIAMAVAVGGGVLALYQPMLGSASLLLGGVQ